MNQTKSTTPHSKTYSEKIGHLYDRLLLSESNRLTDKNHTIHKKLHFPQTSDFENISDINDWLKAQLNIAEDARILDAGCGVGGTLFALINHKQIGLGITLSQKQREIALSEALRLGLNNQIYFAQQSYDDPLSEQFDLIISIEALTHSSDLANSIRNLGNHLNSDGRIVVVEDMAKTNRPLHPIAQMFTRSWQLQKVYSVSDYQNSLKAAGLNLIQIVDFSPYVVARKWPISFLYLLSQLIKMLPERIKGAKDIFVGGLVLETLYARGLMTYKILIAQKE